MNEVIFQYLNNFTGISVFFDKVIIFSAETLGIILLVGLVVFLFSHEHDKRQGFHNIVIILGTAFIAWVATEVINSIYPSPRPFIVLNDVNSLINHGGMDSFPSGHATFFSAIATSLYFYHKKIAVFYALGALVVGVARVVAGVHWPIDIFAGYVIGAVVAFFIFHLYNFIFKKW